MVDSLKKIYHRFWSALLSTWKVIKNNNAVVLHLHLCKKKRKSNHPAVKEVNFLTGVIYIRQMKKFDALYFNISDQ